MVSCVSFVCSTVAVLFGTRTSSNNQVQVGTRVVTSTTLHSALPAKPEVTRDGEVPWHSVLPVDDDPEKAQRCSSDEDENERSKPRIMKRLRSMFSEDGHEQKSTEALEREKEWLQSSTTDTTFLFDATTTTFE